MPRILVLGYSSIARRRAIPSFSAIEGVTVDLASRRSLDAADLDTPLSGAVWTGYDAALEASEAEFVYVSTANHDHEPWTRKALESGRHVIVDKPAFLDLAETDAMLELADKRGVCLAEATVFPFHPRFEALSEVIAGRPVRRVHASFVIPPLPDTDFRYDPKAGGGALLDLGPYAACVCRIMKGETPVSMRAAVTGRHAKGVDLGFGLLATFADGAVYTGQFGFDGEYVNRLWANGLGWMVDCDRAYTPPPTAETTITVREVNETRTVTATPGDTFGSFARGVMEAVCRRDWSAFSGAMAFDARFRDMLTRAALDEGVSR